MNVQNDFDDFVIASQPEAGVKAYEATLSPELKAVFSELKPETKRILAQIAATPTGTTMSYKDIGSKAGLVNGARQVARALHGMSEKYELPWWRIIGSDGKVKLPAHGGQEQIKLLRAEGVEVTDSGRIIS